MNERIKELALQADAIILGSVQSKSAGLLIEKWEQKFAELLIRECTDIADNYDGVGSTIVSRIKEHFGIEEHEKVVPKPECSVCGTTENVKYMGGHQPYLCDSEDCIPY
jgi:hypothetical protein